MVLTIVFLCLLGSSIESRRITGDNMAPALEIGDRVLFDTAVYRFSKQFKRGDVVLFYPPMVRLKHGDLDYTLMGMLERAARPPRLGRGDSSVKRIIALPGDRVEIVRGKGVFINGALLNEPYVKNAAQYDVHVMSDIGGRLFSEPVTLQPFSEKHEPLVVPVDCCFVLGDNRNHSEDSHLYGPVRLSRIIGKAVLVYFPRVKKVGSD